LQAVANHVSKETKMATKSLKNGSGGGTRTPDTRIMISNVSLNSRDISKNHTPHVPQNADTCPDSANQVVCINGGKFDHSSTLPRSSRLTDKSVCRLYFLARAGLIKIGITTNMVSRMRSIRNSCPVPLELLAFGCGNTVFEGLAHSRFKQLRRHGEWFEDEGSIRRYILELARIPNREIIIPDNSSLQPLSMQIGGAA
jgi:hypothetical protein